jgi:hypothetical protein
VRTAALAVVIVAALALWAVYRENSTNETPTIVPR